MHCAVPHRVGGFFCGRRPALRTKGGNRRRLHRPGPASARPHSNAAVIILDDGVLVVDTHSKPSAARALINKIKTVTDKPVRYVVDSHFHYDHFQGNGAYREAFPGVQVIASEPTRHGIVHRGIPRIKAELAGGEGFRQVRPTY